MLPLIAVAGVAIVGLVILWRQSTSHGAGLFLLSALPMALLFLVVPLPFLAVQSIKAFQQVAQSGQSNLQTAASLALLTARPLWLAAVGCVVLLSVAALLRVLLGRRSVPSEEESVAVQASAPIRATRVIVGTSIVALPVCLLYARTGGIAPLVMEAGTTLTTGVVDPAPLVAGMSLGELSALISFRLVLAAGGGIILILITLACMVLNLHFNRISRTSPSLEKYSWAVFAAVGITAIWNLLNLSSSIPAYTQALG